MSKSDDKIRGIYEGQKAELPGGFWDSLEPNIPVYPAKKKRFLGLPLMGCLAISTISIGLVASIGYFFFIKSDQSIPVSTQGNTQIEKLSSPSTESYHAEVSTDQTGQVATFLEATPDNVSVKTKAPSSTLPVKELSSKSNNHTSQRYNPSVLAVSKSTESSTSKVTDLGGEQSLEDQTNTLNSMSNKTSPTNVEMSVITQRENEMRLKKEEDSFSSNKEVEIFEVLAPIDLLEPLLQVKPSQFDLEVVLIEPVKTPLPPKGDYFVEFGYNALFMNRDLNSEMRNLSLSRRELYETPFISHEANLKAGKYFTKHFHAFGGIRYTRIQELFDYQKDTVSTADFKLAQGRRTIEHTNTISMLDATLGVGLDKSWGKWGLGVELEGGYNIGFDQSGKLLDRFGNVVRIKSFNRNQDVNMFKQRSGISLGLKVAGSYSINNHADIRVSVGLRDYLSSFTTVDWMYSMNYDGVNSGLALRYRF